MLKNNFDKAMDYIDANIEKKIDDIKKGLFEDIGYNSNQFNHCLKILTNESLYNYIVARKLYYVSQDLIENPEKKICDIAQDFGFSEQSALNRMIKTYYGCTPNDIRNKGVRISNDKYSLSDFKEKTNDSRLDTIMDRLEHGGYITNFNWDYLEEIYHLSGDFGFSIDTAYQIAELAERLNVAVSSLMEACFELRIEEQGSCVGDWNNLPEHAKVAIHLGIKSDEELEKICGYYQCKYYDLDEWMVEKYYENKAEVFNLSNNGDFYGEGYLAR